MSDLVLDRLREWRAETAIILGSGLSSIVGDADKDRVIPYAELKDIARPSIAGHTGQFVLSEIGRTRVIYAQGRVHLYQGFSARVRLLEKVGIKRLILTNAAGSLNPKFSPGEWMMISDHINLTGTSPLLGTPRCDVLAGARRSNDNDTPQFVDLTAAYSPRLRKQFADAAREIDMILHEGVYASLLGPQYETPAEVRMLRSLGVDAIGMSTVLEVIQARALGLEVAGFSCLTNWAAGIGMDKLNHKEVLETGKAAAENFAQLLRAFR